MMKFTILPQFVTTKFVGTIDMVVKFKPEIGE